MWSALPLVALALVAAGLLVGLLALRWRVVGAGWVASLVCLVLFAVPSALSTTA